MKEPPYGLICDDCQKVSELKNSMSELNELFKEGWHIITHDEDEEECDEVYRVILCPDCYKKNII